MRHPFDTREMRAALLQDIDEAWRGGSWRERMIYLNPQRIRALAHDAGVSEHALRVLLAGRVESSPTAARAVSLLEDQVRNASTDQLLDYAGFVLEHGVLFRANPSPSNAVPLTVVPLTVKAASRWVGAVHSHLSEPRGALFAAGVESDDRLLCAGLVGRPSARLLDDGQTAEITRVACDTTPNAASMLLGALRAGALALGYRRVVSYTLLGESGTSYRAAGFVPTSVSDGGDWGRPSRARTSAAQGGRKVRWEAGPSAAPKSPEVAEVVRQYAGNVSLAERALPPPPTWRRGAAGYSASTAPKRREARASSASTPQRRGARAATAAPRQAKLF